MRAEDEGYRDANWAAFCGSYLMHIPRAFGDRVGDPVLEEIAAGLRRACACIRQRDVAPRYTNIALLSASVLTVSGEMCGWPEYLEEGRRKLREYVETLNLAGGFHEYTSPTYYGVSLSALCWMAMFVEDEEIADLALRIQHRMWTTIAAHYHGPTGQLAGPHSRAYGNVLQRYAAAGKYYLYKVLGEAFDLGESAAHGGDTTYAGLAALQDVSCPEGDRERMLDPEHPRTVVEAVETEGRLEPGYTGPFTQMTTHLRDAFALGTVNRSEAWGQRRNLMLHFRDASGAPSALWEEVREGDAPVRGRDIGFRAVQSGPRALVLHDLSSLEEKEIEALTLALAVEAQRLPEIRLGKRSAEELPVTIGGRTTLVLRFGDVAAGLRLLVEGLGGGRAPGEIRTSKPGLEAVLDLYRGEARRVKGEDFATLPCVYAFEARSVASDRAFEAFVEEVREWDVRIEARSGGVSALWRTETKVLAIRPADGGDRYETEIDGRPVEAQRLVEGDV